MAINVPMESLEKVIYKGTELNEFTAAGCTWRKPCTLSVNSENWDAVSYLELERSPVSNTVNALAAAGWEVLEFQDAQTAPIVYGDTISWTVEAAEGWNAPRMTARGNVSSYEEDGGDSYGNSGRFIATGNCEAYLEGATRRTCTVQITVSSGIERWDLTAAQPDGTSVRLSSGANTVQYGSTISGEYEALAGYVLVPSGAGRATYPTTKITSTTTINLRTSNTISDPAYVSQSSSGTNRSITVRNNNTFTVSATAYWEYKPASTWNSLTAGADNSTYSVAPGATVKYTASNGNQTRCTITFKAGGQLTSNGYVANFAAYSGDSGSGSQT